MIKVNMAKALEIKKDMIRAERKPMLESLDVAYMKAQELGDTEKQKQIAQKKQALRDATDDPEIVSASTPDELRDAVPAAFSLVKTEVADAV